MSCVAVRSGRKFLLRRKEEREDINLEKKLNVLFITSDQQHRDTIGKFNPKIKTPNIDRLIDDGIWMDRAYTVNPTCTPTRASWITGKYPSQHGAWSLGTKLMESEHTIGEDLHAAGYSTALIGKAHFQPLASSEKYPSLEAYPVLQDLEFWKNSMDRFMDSIMSSWRAIIQTKRTSGSIMRFG